MNPAPPINRASGPDRRWLLIGCAALLFGMFACAGGVGAFFAMVVGILKRADVYKEALAQAQNSAEVQSALGTPVEDGWMMVGSIRYENDAGDAQFAVPLTGPKGTGSLEVDAKREGGTWYFKRLEVRVDGGGIIDLKPGLDGVGARQTLPEVEH